MVCSTQLFSLFFILPNKISTFLNSDLIFILRFRVRVRFRLGGCCTNSGFLWGYIFMINSTTFSDKVRKILLCIIASNNYFGVSLKCFAR